MESQHGSAAGIDQPASAPATENHAGGNNDPNIRLAAATIAAVGYGASPATRRRPADTGSPLLDAERRRRLGGEHTPSLQARARTSSRSPHPVTPPARASVPPASPDWHQDIPGHDATVEELRGFILREVGQLHANARTQAERSYEARLDIEALKKAMGTKADFDPAKSAFEEERAIFEAKVAMINEGMTDFGTKVMQAFSYVENLEANLQKHVTGSFAEVVTAMQWLDTSVDARFAKGQLSAVEMLSKFERKLVEFEVSMGSGARATAPARAEAGSVPDLAGAKLSGPAAGPFACGQCGHGCPTAPVREPPGNLFREPPSRPVTSAPAAGGCHCPHVTKLQEEMVDVKLKISHMQSSFGTVLTHTRRGRIGPRSG